MSVSNLERFYYKRSVLLSLLQQEGIRTIVGDPHTNRRDRSKQCRATKETLNKAKRAVTSTSGKALLKKRGEHLQRNFCHVLDHGNLRKATLRGRQNLSKRQLVGAMSHNLTILMRHLTGQGTAKQWQAKAMLVILALKEHKMVFQKGSQTSGLLVEMKMDALKVQLRKLTFSIFESIDIKTSPFSTGC